MKVYCPSGSPALSSEKMINVGSLSRTFLYSFLEFQTRNVTRLDHLRLRVRQHVTVLVRSWPEEYDDGIIRIAHVSGEEGEGIDD